MIGLYASPDQASIRSRLAKTIRLIVSQRLLPRKDGSGRIPVIEVLRFNSDIRQFLEQNDFSTQKLLQIMKGGLAERMQHFDAEIAKLVRAGAVDLDTALMYATDPEQLRQALSASR